MHLLFKWFSADFFQAICWTLVHSIWQGLIAAVVAAFIIMLTKRSAVSIRYNLLMAVLFLFVLSVGITLYRQIFFHTTTNDLSASAEQGVAGLQINFDKAELPPWEPSAPQSLLSRLSSYFDRNASFIVLIWFVLFAIKCTRLVAGLHYIWRLRHRRNYEVSPEWKVRLTQLAEQTGIKRAVMFLESELIHVPVVVGFLKPLLLVPVGLLSNLPAEQVETILLHELAHIRRKDFLVNLLQSFIETFFFFNPALLWISSLIREEREACCDDAVIAHLPQKTNYVQALISFQELNLCAAAHAMALTGRKNYLFNRVKRMLTQENKKLNFMEKTVLLFSIIAVTAFGFIAKKTEAIAASPIPVHEELTKPVRKEVSGLVEMPPLKKPVLKKQKPVSISLTNNNADTSRRFSSISSSIHNDGNTVVSSIEATDNTGKTYRIKRMDGQITELLVNGTVIPQSRYGDYDEVIGQIDETQRQRIARKKEGIEKKRAVLAARHKELFKKREAMAQKNGRDREEKIRMKREFLKQNQLKMAERKKAFALKDSLRKFELSQKKREFAQKQKRFKAEYARKTNGDISNIIHDLNSYNLISDAESLSFSLNNNELIVNGKKQPAEIFQKLKEKYIQNPGDRFNYSKNGNTTNITISRN